MIQRNRIDDYYATACEYLSLPITARFLLGTHFKIIPDEVLVFSDKNGMDETIFKEVFKRGIYNEFKRLTAHFKKSRSYAH